MLFLILHLASSYEATKHGMYFAEAGLHADVREFFSRPIPWAIWEEVKIYQDSDFVRFLEEAMDPEGASRVNPPMPLDPDRRK